MICIAICNKLKIEIIWAMQWQMVLLWFQWLKVIQHHCPSIDGWRHKSAPTYFGANSKWIDAYMLSLSMGVLILIMKCEEREMKKMYQTFLGALYWFHLANVLLLINRVKCLRWMETVAWIHTAPMVPVTAFPFDWNDTCQGWNTLSKTLSWCQHDSVFSLVIQWNCPTWFCHP